MPVIFPGFNDEGEKGMMMKKIMWMKGVLCLCILSASASVIYDNGTYNPDNTGAGASEANYRLADDILLTGTDTIRSVQFWGAHWSSGTVPAVGDFELVIYGDASGLPDSNSVLGTSALSLASRVDTGYDHNDENGANILGYTMNLDVPVTLDAGAYWLSIYLAINVPSTIFVWQESGADGSGNSHQSSDSGASWFNQSTSLAFSMSNTTAIPEPTSAILMGVFTGFGFYIRRRFRR
jgi:hypothetical protein